MSLKRKCPSIYWSQTDNEVNLNVDLLLDDMHPNIKLEDKFLSLEAYGFASADSGPQKYYFELDLYESINVEDARDNVTSMGSQIRFALKKNDSNIWWPRLTAQPQKQNFVHIDEENWIPRISDDLSNGQQEYRDIRTDYPGIDDLLHEEELGYRKINAKTVYLIVYNLFQFIGYLYIMLVLLIAYHRDGHTEAIKIAYKTVGNAMKFCQLLQYLEAMHALFGYTKGSPLFPLMQVTGRNFILFAMINAEPRVQDKSIIFYLFIIWSLVECIRYPYYIITLLKQEIRLLTWLRYTIWIPLYPLGFICEGIIVLRNLSLFEETKRFTVVLPNKWNFTFCMVSFMKIYMAFVLFPGLFIVMKHMSKMRSKKLKTTKVVQTPNCAVQKMKKH